MSRGKYLRNNNIKWREEKNGALFLDSENDTICKLNSTATLIWKLCDGKHGISNICKIIEKTFKETHTANVTEDVKECINSFINRRWLIIIEK